MKLIAPLVLGAAVLVSSLAQATEIIHYENKPVTIQLHKGDERSIQFGDHVEVGITKGQQMKRLFRVQSAQGAVHFLPYEEFDRQRVQIKRLSDGRVILLDLVSETKSKKVGDLEDVQVLLESENTVPTDESVVEDNNDGMMGKVITPVELTRYVSQRLYGPSRLHRDLMGVTESSVDVEGAIRVFKGANKLATVSRAVVAYAGGGHNIAGILIRNISDKSLQLDYLDLNLPFSHATFQHHVLSPAGTPGDNTVLYLVTERSLKEALHPWTYYRDLQAEKKAKEIAKAEAEREREMDEHNTDLGS
tara:strand:+ start:13079 stop:13993 length:915 start_codon:yes stop_codon:yes gene_type:complete